MSDVNGMTLKAEDIRYQCPPSCRRNRSHEPCACAKSSKLIMKVVIAAKWEGVTRYSAWFTPLSDEEKAKRIKAGKEESLLPRISNKQRHNEQGKPVESGVSIPDNIYQAMVEMAAAIIAKQKTLPG